MQLTQVPRYKGLKILTIKILSALQYPIDFLIPKRWSASHSMDRLSWWLFRHELKLREELRYFS